MKSAAESAIRSGAKGVKICCAGRFKVQKLRVMNGLLLVLFHCILYVQILIMHWQKQEQRTVLLVFKYGFAKVNTGESSN